MSHADTASAAAMNAATRYACAVVWLLGAAPAFAAEAEAVTFDDVAPLFAARCVMCHSGGAAPLALTLDSYAAVLAGSRNGPIVRAGDVEGSELIRRVKGQTQPRMPMTGPPFLVDAEVVLLERWITGGLEAGTAQVRAPSAPVAAPARRPGDPVTYADVAPVFAQRCVKCHTAQGEMGEAPEGFLLDSYAATLAADSWARVVPGSPEASELVRRIRGQARPRMPYDGPPYLRDDEIALIVEWIEQGAPDATGARAAFPTGSHVRVHGTLQPGWHVDGLEFVATPSTRVDKSPATGDYVQLRGRLRDDGTVVADRLRRR